MARGGPLEYLYNLNPFAPAFWPLLFASIAIYYYYYRQQQQRRGGTGGSGGGYAYTPVQLDPTDSTHRKAVATGTSTGANALRSLISHLTGNGHHRWVLFVYGLLVVSCIGWICGEIYFYQYTCSTSVRYQHDLVSVTKQTIRALDGSSSSASSIAGSLSAAANTAEPIPYWLDFASLLAVLRQSPVTWDHDHDLSIVYPRDLPAVMKRLECNGIFQVSLDATRDLVQLYRTDPTGRGQKRGAHVDLWLWRVKTADGQDLTTASDDARGLIDPSELWLSSADNTLRYNPRRYSDMLPPRKMWWPQATLNASIPADSVGLALKSFGSTWNIPMYNRADCFHNFWQGRWAF